jgi:Tfp pilus assembly protein PilV
MSYELSVMGSPRSARSGIAGLIIVVSIAFFLLAVGILVAIQGNTSVVSDQLAAQADRAQFLAQTGIDDALMKIARNKTYSGSYVIAEANGTVNVSVVTDSASSTIISTSTVAVGPNSVQRTVQASAYLNSDGIITSVTRTNL